MTGTPATWIQKIAVMFCAAAFIGSGGVAAANDTTDSAKGASPQWPISVKASILGPGAALSVVTSFTLSVHPEKGEVQYLHGPDQELQSILAKNGVEFISKDLKVNSRSLEYDVTTGVLTFSGPGLKIKLSDNTLITSDKFFLNVRQGSSTAEGNVVKTTRKKGRVVRVTRGEKVQLRHLSPHSRDHDPIHGGSAPAPER